MLAGTVTLTAEQIARLEIEVPKRIARLQEAIDFFTSESLRKYNDAIVFKENAAETLAIEYYSIIYTQWKDLVEDRIDTSKICSSTEMAVINVVPIVSSSTMSTRYINAMFAYHLGTFFCMYVGQWSLDPVDFEHHDFETRFSNIINDHIMMLEGLIGYEVEGRQTFPLAANAQNWKLLEFIFIIKKNMPYPLF